MDIANDIDFKKLYSIIIDSVDFSDVGLCDCNTKGEIQYVNQSFVNIFSIGKNPGSIAGKKINDIVPEFDQIKKTLSSGRTDNGVEFSIKREHEKWLAVNAHNLKCSMSGDESTLYIVRDTTFYKKLQLELLKADKIVSSLVSSSEDIIYRLDTEGNITFISQSIEKYGYNPDELLGKSILEIVHPEDRKKARFRLNERRSGKRKTALFEIRLVTKETGEDVAFEFENREDVASQYFLITAEGLYLSESPSCDCFMGTQGIARDITGRRRVEIKLKDTENKWHNILNTLEDGYYEVDLSGNFTFVNNSLVDILGMTAEEICGKNFTEIFTSEDSKKLFDTFNTLYKTGNPVKLVDLAITRHDGKKLRIEGSISLILSSDGEPAGFRGITRDVTEKVKMEEEFARAKKLEAIGILAGGIAHDFNNALTAIMGNLSLAKMEIPEENTELKEIIDDAESASFKIMELTNKLSSFAKGGRPVKKTLNIKTLIEETTSSVMADFKGEYSIKIDEELKMIDVDEIQISQALENILKNSIEATGDKGRISISVSDRRVEEEVSYNQITLQAGEYVLIEIEDDGPGIDRENIDKIFDPYYSTKESAGGMGLATSFAVIKRHHGYINVKSEPGKGTVFSIYLPVHSE